MKKLISWLIISAVYLNIATIPRTGSTYTETLFVNEYDEVLTLADSYEHALQIAEVYSLELESYSDGIASFRTPHPERAIAFSQSSIAVSISNIAAVMPGVSDPFPPLSLSQSYTTLSLPAQWHHTEMNNYHAWDFSTGEGVVIAVIDTGINVYHPQFAGRISPVSYDSYRRLVGVHHVHDDLGHGTNVAGIAAAASNGNTSGTAPGAEIMVIKSNDPNEGSFPGAAILRGINYAVDNGADIINLSFGREFVDENGNSNYNELEHQVIRNAVESGVTVVAAAGNDGVWGAAYPAAYPEVIAVSATRRGFEFDDDYSNFGPQVDIAAPGSRIRTTSRNGGTVTVSGTSMAAPNIAGVAALIKAANPDYTVWDIKQALYSTTRGNDGNGTRCDFLGFGIVDSGRAVESALPPIITIVEPLPLLETMDIEEIFTMEFALYILRYTVALYEPTPEQYQHFDINGDGIIDINDAITILKVIVGLLPFPEYAPGTEPVQSGLE
jgi:subtilisin family serine protease